MFLYCVGLRTITLSEQYITVNFNRLKTVRQSKNPTYDMFPIWEIYERVFHVKLESNILLMSGISG